MFKQLRPFHQRLIVSFLGTFILLMLTYVSLTPFFKPVFAFAMGGAIAFALWEFYRICGLKGHEPIVIIALITSLAYTFALFLREETLFAAYIPQTVLFLFLSISFLCYCVHGEKPILNLSLIFFGIVYLTVPLSFAPAINFIHSDQGIGRWWFIYLLAVVKVTDIGAYFIGKQFGKTLMSPVISPKKTWEGAIGGLLFGVLTSIIFFKMLGPRMELTPGSLTLTTALVLGALLSVAAQFGDLAESLIKRDGGVKDSNHLPGLGGMLDILDSLVFASPILYLFLIVQ